jgi:hypothetical protein
MISRITHKLDLKSARDLFNDFQKQVETNVLSEVRTKIDKIELKRAQFKMKKNFENINKKIDYLEGEIGNDGPQMP